MNREHIAYQIYYSHLLESMTSRFNGRVNKILSFLLFILGSAVVSQYFNALILGVLIALISALNTVGSYGATAELARVQSSRYLRLYNSLHSVETDADLMHQLMKIQEDDKIPNPTIANLAEREAGKTFKDFMIHEQLSRKEKIYSIFLN